MSIDSRIVKNVVFEQIHRIGTISDLARLLGCPLEALRKEFNRREGIPIAGYVSEVRTEHAKELLLNSELKCKEICLAIGFSRADVGARVFKRHTGLSMEEFRRIGKRQEELKTVCSESGELADKNRLTIPDNY